MGRRGGEGMAGAMVADTRWAAVAPTSDNKTRSPTTSEPATLVA